MSENLPALRANTAMVFMENVENNWRLATAIAKSGMVPYKTPDACIAIMLACNELDIPIMVGMRNMHFYEGRIIMGSGLLWGLAVSRRGLSKEVHSWTPEKYSATYYRDGWPPMKVEWTIEEAKRAGLTRKSNWNNFPADMLAARCDARACRAIAPDYFAGVYVDAEFAEDTRAAADDGEQTVEALNLALGLDGEPEPTEAK